MQRTDFSEMTCSIARSLAVAGEPWSPMVLRDVWVGINRFDGLQRDLGISRGVFGAWRKSRGKADASFHQMRERGDGRAVRSSLVHLDTVAAVDELLREARMPAMRACAGLSMFR
jgi:hypothetical protein